MLAFNCREAVINGLIEKKGTIRILDLGGNLSYWENMNWKSTATHISLLNLTQSTIPDESKHLFEFLIKNSYIMDIDD